MYKTVLIDTHGVTIVDGSAIHCHAVFNTSEAKFKYLYNSVGQLIQYHDGQELISVITGD